MQLLHMEEFMAKTSEIAPEQSMKIGELVSRIESMSGKEKQAFCRTLSSEEKTRYVQYLRDRDMEKVKVIFKCYDPMGGMVKFTAKPYEGYHENYELYDGQEYEIPLCIAKRFNNEFQGIGCFYPTHAYILDAQGKPMISIGKKNFRFNVNSPDLM